MAAVDDLDQVIEQCQRALDEFVKGNPKPMQEMFFQQAIRRSGGRKVGEMEYREHWVPRGRHLNRR